MRERNITVDILKTLGMLLIILAHVNPPNIIFQLRNFDVPLLVILSGLLGAKTFNEKSETIKYIIKRINRLIIPVWIFLTLFFIVIFIFNKIGYNFDILNWKTIIKSYLLIDGIGYVWIIRIYILCAITLIIIMKLQGKTKLDIYMYIFLYILYEVVYYFFGNTNIVLEYIIYYIIPYGIICTFIGTKLENMKNKTMIKTSIIFLICTIILSIWLTITNKSLVSIQVYKYPPRFYYLSYAIGMSLLLYYLVDRINIFNIKNKLNNKIILFISSHSMWLYLWHILIIYILKNINLFNWFIKYIIILGISLILTYIQTTVIKKLKVNNKTILSIFNG